MLTAWYRDFLTYSADAEEISTRRVLFNDLAISKNEEAMDHFGKYGTIYLDFSVGPVAVASPTVRTN